MSAFTSGLTLEEGMLRSDLTFEELWMGVLSLGGELDELEVEAYVLGVLTPGMYEHNIIAQALNEVSVSDGHDHPVAYRRR
jgi:hypothetical protein